MAWEIVHDPIIFISYFFSFRTYQIPLELIFVIILKVYSKHNYRKDENFRDKRGYKRNRYTVMLNAFRKLSTSLLTEISKLEKFPLLNSSAGDGFLFNCWKFRLDRAPLSAFVSFAHVHVHTIPVELHPPCPRHAHTFSKSQLTSPLYSESPSPRERNTVENLTNFSFRSCTIALTPLLLGSFQTERYRPFTSSIPFILSSAFQTNWKRWNPRL